MGPPELLFQLVIEMTVIEETCQLVGDGKAVGLLKQADIFESGGQLLAEGNEQLKLGLSMTRIAIFPPS